VCHQTVSLVARHLDENGLPTVVVGSARDIVEECGVARFLFSDFPLGNPCGRPHDRDMQRAIAGMALDLLESARMPRTTVQTPFVWDAASDEWKDRYARVDPAQAEAMRLAGQRRRAAQARIKSDDPTRSD
jgi:D-proline reductase (dithiol) PrdB